MPKKFQLFSNEAFVKSNGIVLYMTLISKILLLPFKRWWQQLGEVIIIFGRAVGPTTEKIIWMLPNQNLFLSATRESWQCLFGFTEEIYELWCMEKQF